MHNQVDRARQTCFQVRRYPHIVQTYAIKLTTPTNATQTTYHETYKVYGSVLDIWKLTEFFCVNSDGTSKLLTLQIPS